MVIEQHYLASLSFDWVCLHMGGHAGELVREVAMSVVAKGNLLEIAVMQRLQRARENQEAFWKDAWIRDTRSVHAFSCCGRRVVWCPEPGPQPLAS